MLEKIRKSLAQPEGRWWREFCLSVAMICECKYPTHAVFVASLKLASKEWPCIMAALRSLDESLKGILKNRTQTLVRITAGIFPRKISPSGTLQPKNKIH